MKNNVSKELETIKLMLDSWEAFYLSQAVAGEDNEYLVDDLIEQITTNLLPYLGRFRELKHINSEEYSNFMTYITNKIAFFTEKIVNKKSFNKIEEKIDTSLLYNQFNVHKDLVDFHEKSENRNEHRSFITEQKIKGYEIAAKLLPYLYKKERSC